MKLRRSVFWPPFLLVAGALALNFWDPQKFLSVMNQTNSWVLDNFSVAFALVGFLAVILCFAVFLSPLGKVRIGGDAPPILPFISWICVSICANTGAGILFWAMAEPIFHLNSPPVSLGLTPGSSEAARFALSTLYMHWSLTPAALYALPALLFAIAFYNLGMPFSISSCLVPLLGKRVQGKASTVIDVIALYTLVLGMAASLATGILSISGGLAHLTPLKSAPPLWIGVGVIIMLGVVIAAVSGIEKGVKNLAQVKTVFILLIALFVFFAGRPLEAWNLSVSGLGQYVSTFAKRSLFLEFIPSDPWPKQWTVFFWAVWLAWAPVCSGFLGRMARGYTVRQFLFVNVFVPTAFAIFWMTAFGSTVLALELKGTENFSKALAAHGAEALSYVVLSRLPLSFFVIIVFIFLVVVAYVFGANSNALSMAALSTEGISPENPEPPTYLKIVWGVLVGTIALVMLVRSGIDGIKTLSYLGGLPALFFEIGVLLSLMKLVFLSFAKKTAGVRPPIYSIPGLEKGEKA